MEKISNRFGESDSVVVRTVQVLFLVTLSRNLAYIKCNFFCIKICYGAWNCGCGLKIKKRTHKESYLRHDEPAGEVGVNNQSVLEWNPGYSTICKIADIVSRQNIELDGNKP